MRKHILLLALFTSACGSSPSAPSNSSSTQQPAVTRVINVTGNLNFGEVTVGDTRTDGILTISNNGNAALAITGMNGPCASSIFPSWVSGSISPGASQTVSVRFTPTAPQSCTGVVTVLGDQTAGTNTISIVATAVAGYSKNLSGTWRGTLVVDTVLLLTQTGSTLSGEYNAINAKGTVSGSVSNKGQVTFTVTIPGYQPFTFSGDADAAGNTISGQVNGSGFVNAAATMRRQ